MVQRDREVINKKNRKLQNTPPFFSFSGWGNKNLFGPAPTFIGAQRRLFYFLQPLDYFLFTFFNILLVIATMHNFPCPLRTNKNSLLVSTFSTQLRIREFLPQRAYKPQGCSRTNKFVPTEKVNHRICLTENRQMLLGYQSIL